MKTLLFLLFTLFFLDAFSQQQTPGQLRAFMQTTPTPANAIPYGANAKAGRYAHAGDTKIYYEVYGKGQPIVLLHGGIFGSTYEMHEFIDSLSKHYQVIAISTRGHGKSGIGTAPVTYEQKANDVMAVIKAVTRERVLVLGFSDGAYAGYKLAAMYPQTVKKLIAIGAGELQPGPRSYHFTQQQAMHLDSAYWKQQLAMMPEPQKLDGYLENLAALYNGLTVSKELFHTIQCPVLLVAGERDANAPLPTIITAYHMIPNSQLSIIPNAGHLVFGQNFAAVWASILPFIK